MKKSLTMADPAKVEKGVWFTYFEDFRVRIRPFSCPEMQKFLTSHRMLAQQSPEDYRDELNDRIARYLITDWEGLEDDDTGEPVAYTVAEGIQRLAEDDAFAKFVAECAATHANFLRTKLEQDAKN